MKIKDLVQTCSACPSQWEFRTFENRPVYVRFRWGYLEVRIGEPDKDIMNAVGGKEIIGKQLGDDFDGVISWNRVESLIKRLPNKLKE
jgi:hypothetical protein